MDLLKALSNMRRQTLEMKDQANEAVVSASDEAKAMWEGKVHQLERELMVCWVTLGSAWLLLQSC